MIVTLAYAVLALTAMYLVALGACSLLRPAMARRFLLSHASSARLHYLELALRLLGAVSLALGAGLLYALFAG